MKSRLFTLVALSMLAASSSYAASANFDWYGKMNVTMVSAWSTSSLTAPDYSARWRLTSNTSYVGAKGTEDLSDGMKFVWQIETGVDVTNPTPKLGDRNTALGFQGGWGALMFGNWDTPYKVVAKEMDNPFGTDSASMTTAFTSAGNNVASQTSTTVGTQATNDQSFWRRQAGSIVYMSPKFSGMDIKFLYNGNGGKSDANPNPSLMSVSANYDGGMITAGAAYEGHTDARSAATFTTANGLSTSLGTPVGSSDTGIKAFAGVKPVDGLYIGGTWQKFKYTNKLATAAIPTGLEDSYSASTLTFALKYSMGSWHFHGDFATAGNGTCTLGSGVDCVVTENGATGMSAMVVYDYSKRTSVYAEWGMINNQTNGTYNFGASGVRTASVVGGQGTDVNAIGIGMSTKF